MRPKARHQFYRHKVTLGYAIYWRKASIAFSCGLQNLMAGVFWDVDTETEHGHIEISLHFVLFTIHFLRFSKPVFEHKTYNNTEINKDEDCDEYLKRRRQSDIEVIKC